MGLRPIQRSSVAEDVVDQLAEEILAGRYEAGDALPSERALAETLGVNRGAVREAMQRLATEGLVRARQGDGTRVLDFRREGGLDLLPRLLSRGDGAIDGEAIAGVAELRACIGADAARLAAVRADDSHHAALQAAATRLRDAPDRAARQPEALALWEAVVDAAGNLAYRLAFNSLVRAYQPVQPLLRDLLGQELDDVAGHQRVVDAILAGDDARARLEADAVLQQGSRALASLATLFRGRTP